MILIEKQYGMESIVEVKAQKLWLGCQEVANALLLEMTLLFSWTLGRTICKPNSTIIFR
jgi:hypothetical protein